jgi:hypothetical protein
LFRALSQRGPITAMNAMHAATCSSSDFHEVDAGLDGVDVHEQLLGVEMLQQSVVKAACRRLVVAAPQGPETA